MSAALSDYDPSAVACSTFHSWETTHRGAVVERTYRLDHADERCPRAIEANGIGTSCTMSEGWPCPDCFVDNPGRAARDAAGPDGNRSDSIDAPESSGSGGSSRPAEPPTDKQVRFLTALVRGSVALTPEWVDGTLSAEDAEGVVESVVSVVTTKAQAMTAIDKLIAAKVDPAWDALVRSAAPAASTSQALAAPARTNRYAATCADCGAEVPAEQGSLTKGATGWEVRHHGGCPERTAAEPQRTDGYVPVEDDVHLVGSDYFRVHISQTSGRPYAAVWNGAKFVGPRYDDRARGALRLLTTATLVTAEQAAAFGYANRRCCFCSHKIDTPESKAVGYGPDCARKRDLPWGER
jgi:hypothetical protein